MKIYWLFRVLPTCIIASPFSEFHNNGCPGYNQAFSFWGLLAPFLNNRAKKKTIRILSQNRLVKGCFPAIWRSKFRKLSVPHGVAILSGQNTKWQCHLWLIIYESIKALEIKTSTINFVFADRTILSFFFFFFLIIDVDFLIPAVIVQIFDSNVELTIPTYWLMKQMQKLKHIQ